MINRDSEVSQDPSRTSVQQPLIVQNEELPPPESSSTVQIAQTEKVRIVKVETEVTVTQQVKVTKERLMSLDAYRGLTVLGMILADMTYEIDGAFWLLIHPSWNGLSFADLVFPSFLFIMGMAIPLAVSPSRPIKAKNIIRVFALFGIGLFLNIIEQQFDWPNLRILGILQRLSLCYGINLFIHWVTDYSTNITKRRIAAFVMLASVGVYVALMLSWSDEGIGCGDRSHNLEPFCNFAGYVDRAVFSLDHIMEKTDPEGLISTITASFTTYIGYVFGLMVLRLKKQPQRLVKYWLFFALICCACIYPSFLIMPSNKRLYTLTFLFIVLSNCAISLSFFMVIVDILPKKYPYLKSTILSIVQPLNWLGLNPLAVFILLQLTMDVINGWIRFDGDRTPYTAFYDVAFAWMGAYIGTLVYTVFYGIVLTIAGGVLFRYKLFLRL